MQALTIPVIVGVERNHDDLDDGEEHEAVDDEGEHHQDVVRVANAAAVAEGGGVNI